MTKNTLLIFVDGFQYDEALRLKVIRSADVCDVKPSIGFSNNIYPEMFCGTTPDEIGYFNEWYPSEATNVSKSFKKLSFLDKFRTFKYLNAILRLIIIKRFFKKFVGNIPFKYIDFFSASGSHNFASFENSLLKKYDFEIFDSALLKKRRFYPDHRDKITVENFLESDMAQKNVLVSLMELDNISHSCGMWSKEYEKHIDFLEVSVEEMSRKFLNENPGASIYLFSDHGMVPVEKCVSLDLDEEFGPMKPEKYLYFLDATYLRVWCSDESLRGRIIDYLSSKDFGKIVDKTEREFYGVTNANFGDVIFRANEGIMFLPNFFGIRAVKAMHGYDSELQSQRAVFSRIAGEDVKAVELPKRTNEIYSFLSKALK